MAVADFVSVVSHSGNNYKRTGMRVMGTSFLSKSQTIK